MIRQQLIGQLTREIMNYDAEYRREDAAGGIGVSRTALILAAAKELSTFRAAEATSRASLDRGVPRHGSAVSAVDLSPPCSDLII